MIFLRLMLETGSGQHPMGVLADERICRFILLAFEKIVVAGDCLQWVPGVAP